jgi:hypothetical protein
MSEKKPPNSPDDLFPKNWVVGTAAAELARGDDDVLVDPHVGRVLLAGPGGRPGGIAPLPRLDQAAPNSTRRQSGRRREPTLVSEEIPGPDRGPNPGPAADGAVSSEELAALWSENARLQRRFATHREPGMAAVDPSPEPATLVAAVPLDDQRPPRARRHHGRSHGWLVALLGSVIVAAAIVMAGRLGLLDAPRAWLHGQIDRLSAPTLNVAESTAENPAVYSIRREPVSPAD